MGTMINTPHTEDLLHVEVEPPTPARRQPAWWWKPVVLTLKVLAGAFASLAVVALGTAAVLVFNQ
jgi:hypothetical protein